LTLNANTTNKSKNPTALLSHTGVYSGLWVLPVIIGGCIFGYSPLMIWFPVITFIAHTITDFFTSRINSSLWKMGKVHYFFVSVGFDQFLHFAQLFLTYWFLTS